MPTYNDDNRSFSLANQIEAVHHDEDDEDDEDGLNIHHHHHDDLPPQQNDLNNPPASDNSSPPVHNEDANDPLSHHQNDLNLHVNNPEEDVHDPAEFDGYHGFADPASPLPQAQSGTNDVTTPLLVRQPNGSQGPEALTVSESNPAANRLSDSYNQADYDILIPPQSVEKFNTSRATFAGSSDGNLTSPHEAPIDVPVVSYSSMPGASENPVVLYKSDAPAHSAHQAAMAHYQAVTAPSGAQAPSQKVEARVALSFQFLPRPKPNKCLLTTTVVAASLHFVCMAAILILQVTLDIYKSFLSIIQAGAIFGLFGATVGLLAIFSYKYSYRRRAITIALLVMSLITLFLAIALVIFAAVDISLSTLLDVYTNTDLSSDWMAIYICNVLLILLAIVEFGLCIWTAVLSCEGLCWCCRPCHSDLSEEEVEEQIQIEPPRMVRCQLNTTENV